MTELLPLASLDNASHAHVKEPTVGASDVLCRGVVECSAQPIDCLCTSETNVSPWRYKVRVAKTCLVARQAESCVLRPESGDVVLVSTGTEQPHYILAVLSRPGDKPRVWQPPDDKPLTLSAERLKLEAAQAVGVHTPLLEINAAKAKLALRTLHLASEVVHGASDTLEWVGKKLQTIAKWSAHRAGCYTRTVQSADTVVAEHMMRTAHQTMTSTSTHTILTAKEDVRVDGKRIHMG